MPGGHSLLRLSLAELTTVTQCSTVHRQWSLLNAAARLVVGLDKYEHIILVLCDVFHWLAVPQRTQFKIATLT